MPFCAGLPGGKVDHVQPPLGEELVVAEHLEAVLAGLVESQLVDHEVEFCDHARVGAARGKQAKPDGAVKALRAGQAAAVTVIMMIVPIAIFILSKTQILETMASSGIKE